MLTTGDGFIQNESYSKGFTSNVESLVCQTRNTLEGIDFDTMAGRGLSGALIIPVLAREMGKHFFIVRKEEESAHTSSLGEGRVGRRWLFVDDFVSSGETRDIVRETVARFCNRAAWITEYVGTYEYYGNRYANDNARKEASLVF